ncbi:MAG: hypothetical protein V7K67_18605 [Nostoc sp.]|uniref:hypothetical protein n=1 Tax=Nostoc sp. TaxID=1180 RepID=UPI002FF32761
MESLQALYRYTILILLATQTRITAKIMGLPNSMLIKHQEKIITPWIVFCVGTYLSQPIEINTSFS